MNRAARILATIIGAVTAVATSFIGVVHDHQTNAALQRRTEIWMPPDRLPAPAAGTEGSGAPRDANALPIPRTFTGRADAGRGPVYRLAVRERAVFVTIDDGNTRDPRVLDLIRATHLPASAFLVGRAVDADPAYWQAMARAGVRIENHTVSHPRLTSMSYASQRAQICAPEARYAGLFGARPRLFRPPFGAWNSSTLRAVSACGLGGTVLWSATYGGGWLETWGNRGLQPGDIVLLHFTPTLYDDLLRLIRMLRARDLGVGSLESYLRLAARPAPFDPPAWTTAPASPSPSRSARPGPRPSRSPSPEPSPSVLPSIGLSPRPPGG